MHSDCNFIFVVKLEKYFDLLFYIVFRGHHKLKLRNILSTYLMVEIYYFIAPLSDIRMFYIRYLTMHKVHMYAGAIRQLKLAKARGLSSRTYAQTLHLLTLIYSR